MNRLYVIESTAELDGNEADHRLPVKASYVEDFAKTLAAAVGLTVTGSEEHLGLTRRLRMI